MASTVDRAEALERQRRACIHASEEKRAEANAITQEVRRHKQAQLDATTLIERGRVLGAELARLEEERDRHRGGFQRAGARVPQSPAARCSGRWRKRQRRGPKLGDPTRGGRTSRALGYRGTRRIGHPRSRARGQGRGLGIRRLSRARCAAGPLADDIHARPAHARPRLRGGVDPVRGQPRIDVRDGDSSRNSKTSSTASRATICFSIPTAEVPVTNLYRDEILDASALPRGFVDVLAMLPARGGRAREGHARTAAAAPVRQGRAGPLLRPRGFGRRSSSSSPGTRKRSCSAWACRTAWSCSPRGTRDSSAAKTYDLEVWAPGVAQLARGLVVQHVH